ncbi:hypothetical protein DM01DRAFT_1322924 [Hesseltinella vesiculosa]|uniref:Uncharacterized protein n=1 Tax=Hesseltinella vesiculosa TaxID=101127 RepID=A0A1X2GHF9_9FUNG|nr:hypothetical protein DM01DRAFT_1322924 [Hesseltinella vesiculosa]
MLHIQENIPHSNSLIISQFLASAQSAAQQIPSIPPSLPAIQLQSSRSTKVIEHLHEKWERIQKELETTRSHDLMSILESKEKTLKTTKSTSVSMESQVKKLKDEAMHSRLQLEALRKQEQTLGKERDRAVAKKEQWERHHFVLQQSLAHLEQRLHREAGSLQQSLIYVQHRVVVMNKHHKQLIRLVITTLQCQSTERTSHYHSLSLANQQLHTYQQHWLKQLQSNVLDLSLSIQKSGSTTDEFHLAFRRCRGEVQGLICKIKAYTTAMV